MTRAKRETRSAYDRMSRWYDLLAGRSERRLRELALQRLDVRHGEMVLEVGSGTGHSVLALVGATGGPGEVYGVDISPGMIRVTRARLARAGVPDGASLVCGDGAALPFRACSFDAALMTFTLELFAAAEVPVVLQEARRVLRGDGRLCVAAMSRKGGSSLATRAYGWAHRRFPKYVDCRPILVEEALEAAGFRVAQATLVSTWGLPVEVVLARANE